jgi:Zn-dependent peptidase ImmA (M78 family)
MSEGFSAADARREAEAMLARFWRGLGLPVDPVAIARAAGIVVRETTMPGHIAGGIVKSMGSAPVLVLNTAHARRDRRFTCAHEIGHHVFATNRMSFDYADTCTDVSPSCPEPAELLANAFAAHLLIPEDHLEPRRSDPAWLLADFFDAPLPIVRWRQASLTSWLHQLIATRMQRRLIE